MQRRRWTGAAGHRRQRPGGWATLAVVGLLAGCADDTTTVTDTAQGTTTQATEAPTVTTDEPTTTVVPTTDAPTSTTSTGTDSTTATLPTTTDATTTDATTTTTTTTTTTDPTDTDTDGTTGDPLVGKSITQTVNSGAVATSPSFRMIFTLGQPTQNQGVYTSSNFRLRGGLIGANGSPP
ncbi:hypothetical protein [Nannocystis punicea]|uniref:Uncharacterized protein n=1 Tax=Nannocystis punicea TaxID=2995304 RepID=A0ABY7HCF8_9BACT|nr:hypothetical protein [Nannocystis poenicansa]WAS96684.1 hypothetical protein O0S08_11085 [Nannocystis poenicansa]